jgi:AraC-like DNA-binding protein
MKVPVIRRIHVNSADQIFGSYIDAEYVLHLIGDRSWGFTLQNTRYVVDEHCMMLIPPNLMHIVEPLGHPESGHQVIHFEVPGGSRSLMSLPHVVRLDREGMETARALFGKLLDPAPRDALARAWYQAGILCQLLAIYRIHAGDAVGGEEGIYPGWAHVQKAVNLIQQQHRFPDCSLAGIAEACRLSPAYMSRLFKRTMGVSPVTYLNQFRVERAQSMLLNTDLTGYEVAERCGFANGVVFCKVFKRRTATTPARWRQKYSGG